MKFVMLLVVTVYVLGGFLYGETVEFSDLIKPQVIKVDKNQIYIGEGPKIHIYSKSDFKKHQSFGKLGTGPAEFRLHPGTPLVLNVQNEHLIVKCRRRIYFYDKTGKYLREVHNSSHSIGAQPLGDNYAGIEYVYDPGVRYLSINIYDNQLELKKNAFKIPHGQQRGKGLRFLQMPEAFMTSFATYRDRLYIIDYQKFLVNVFDQNGKKLYTVQRKYNHLKLNADYREKVVEYFKTDPFQKQFYQQLYHPVTFPEYFPAIRDMRVNDDRIYLLTYKAEKKRTECYIYHISGEFLKKTWLPVEAFDLDFYPYDISGNSLYQLVENQDNETWELRIHPII